MEKYYVGDDDNKNEESTPKVGKITLEVLKEKVKNMSIYADVTSLSQCRANVVVHKNMGTTMYLSSEFNDHFWLQDNAVKKEELGGIVKYHFVLD
jgi:hypothetical protein